MGVKVAGNSAGVIASYPAGKVMKRKKQEGDVRKKNKSPGPDVKAVTESEIMPSSG